MGEQPKYHEYRVETGSRFSWDAGGDENEFRLQTLAFMMEHGIVPPSRGEDGHATLLGDEHVFGDIVLRLTETQADQLRSFLAEAAGEHFPYEERDRLVVRADEDELRD